MLAGLRSGDQRKLVVTPVFACNVEGEEVMGRFRFAPFASRLLVGLLSSGARSGTAVDVPDGTVIVLGEVWIIEPCCWMIVEPVVAHGSIDATTGVPHGSPVETTGPETTPPVQQASAETTDV